MLRLYPLRYEFVFSEDERPRSETSFLLDRLRNESVSGAGNLGEN